MKKEQKKNKSGNEPAKKPAGRKKEAVLYEDFTFGRQSYRLLIIGLILIGVGFALMVGGGSGDPEVFSEDIFSHRRITLGPILVLAGYVVEVFAIMKRPPRKKQSDPPA